MKTTIAALAIALALPLGLGVATESAQAKTNVSVGIFFGQPHYRYAPNDNYVYRRGYGWYMPRDRMNNRISCGAAKRDLRNRGFRILTTRDCQGSEYVFRVERNGNVRLVSYNARNGRIVRI